MIDANLELFYLKDEMGIPINIIDKHFHTHPDKKSIRIVKERIYYLTQSFPSNCIPKSIIYAIVENVNDNYNRMPRKKGNGFSEHYSPLAVCVSTPALCVNKLNLAFGECAEAYEENNYKKTHQAQEESLI